MCCYICVGRVLAGPTLFCSFLVGALAFWLFCKPFKKPFSFYLSIKYTALSLFVFVRVLFLFYLSIYQLVHAPFSFPTLSPYPIPSSSDFFSFFFFYSSSLPSLFRPSSTPPFPLSMDDTQTAFATQYPPYGFDLDMMKARIFPSQFFSGDITDFYS